MNNNEAFSVSGQLDIRVYDALGNLKSKEIKSNNIESAFKTHLIKLIGDSNTSNAGNTGSTYNADAAACDSVSTQQIMPVNLGGTDNTGYTYPEDRIDIVFADTSANKAIGNCTSGVVTSTSGSYSIGITSKITDAPNGTTWDDVYLAVNSAYDSGGAGSTTEELAIASGEVNQQVDQYDTFVIAWTISFTSTSGN